MSISNAHIRIPDSVDAIQALLAQVRTQPSQPGEDRVIAAALEVLRELHSQTVLVSLTMCKIAMRTHDLCDQKGTLSFGQIWPDTGKLLSNVLKKNLSIVLPLQIRLPTSLPILKESLYSGANWPSLKDSLKAQGFPDVEVVIEAAAQSLSYLLGGTLPLEKGVKEMRESLMKLPYDNSKTDQLLAIVLPLLTQAVVKKFVV